MYKVKGKFTVLHGYFKIVIYMAFAASLVQQFSLQILESSSAIHVVNLALSNVENIGAVTAQETL